MKSRIVIAAFVLLSVSALNAQDATPPQKQLPPKQEEVSSFPESDIFLFKVNDIEGKFGIGSGKNVTSRPGYENQPFFSYDSTSFLFTRSEGSQTDVFEYFLGSGETKRVTQSKNMEFSPTPSPDNQTISFVTDGEGANQSIWHINRSDVGNPVWTLKTQPEREPVGYHSWNHETGYIIFWSRYGHAIRLVHESKELSHYVTGHAVPATPWIIPGTKRFSFVHRQANGATWIKELDPETRSVRPLVAITGANHHYNWLPDGSIVMAQDMKVVRWKENSTDGWEEMGDLSETGLASANRVAASPDGKWLAIVGVPIEVGAKDAETNIENP